MYNELFVDQPWQGVIVMYSKRYSEMNDYIYLNMKLVFNVIHFTRRQRPV